MALNNMRKEPGRELTESLLGFIPLVLLIPLYYWSQYWLNVVMESKFSSKGDWLGCTIVSMVASVIAALALTAIACGIAHLLHSWGEGICALLARFNLDPRPKVRNVKWWWSPDPRIAEKEKLIAQAKEIQNRTDLSEPSKRHYLQKINYQIQDLRLG